MTLSVATSTLADIDPNSGIDFVRIGAVGNAPWPGNGRPVDEAIGRGRVDYEYSIGRLEVTTAQWAEFMNACYDRPVADRIPFVNTPGFWGAAEASPTAPGGRRWVVGAGNEDRLVGGISWRAGAVYCNWLCNNKSLERAAFMTGAYEVSTFGNMGGIFTDQLAHTPGARYWLPTWDEWLKAAHYDPNRSGQDQGGWWVYSNGTDSPLLGGPPGVGQANFGTGGSVAIALGAYPMTRSPWGLLDVAGGTLEWTEEMEADSVGNRYRIQDGSAWTYSQAQGVADGVFTPSSSEFPWIFPGDFGIRIASSVPAPNTGILGACVLGLIGTGRQRRDVARHLRPALHQRAHRPHRDRSPGCDSAQGE